MHIIVTVWETTQQVYTMTDWEHATSFVEFVNELVILGGAVMAVIFNSNDKKK